MAVSAEVKNPSPPPDMLSVLKPLPDRIRLLRDELFWALPLARRRCKMTVALQTEAARSQYRMVPATGSGNADA